MTLVADAFSDHFRYAFHIDSGPRFDETNATTTIECRFDDAQRIACRVGDADQVRGDASGEAGISGEKQRFRVFAGLRDDPFFNNVRGTRDALGKAAAALLESADGCPAFDAAASRTILEAWRHTEGGPATNFLATFQSASLVVAVDLEVVATAGPMLAIWSATYDDGGTQIDRMGRPLTGNGLLAPLARDDVSDALKESYNRATRERWRDALPEIRQTLALYDGFDGICGNQWLAERGSADANRYNVLARLLGDDRLWINTRSTRCERFLGVELASPEISALPTSDCGGRTPTHDAVDVYRSLLVSGRTTGVPDGVDHDEHEHSSTAFPFLAAPARPLANRREP